MAESFHLESGLWETEVKNKKKLYIMISIIIYNNISYHTIKSKSSFPTKVEAFGPGAWPHSYYLSLPKRLQRERKSKESSCNNYIGIGVNISVFCFNLLYCLSLRFALGIALFCNTYCTSAFIKVSWTAESFHFSWSFHHLLLPFPFSFSVSADSWQRIYRPENERGLFSSHMETHGY